MRMAASAALKRRRCARRPCHRHRGHPACHGLISLRIIEQPLCCFDDGVPVGADQLDHAEVDRLRAFGFLSKDQHRFAQGRGLFLHAPESLMIRYERFIAAINGA